MKKKRTGSRLAKWREQKLLSSHLLFQIASEWKNNRPGTDTHTHEHMYASEVVAATMQMVNKYVIKLELLRAQTMAVTWSLLSFASPSHSQVAAPLHTRFGRGNGSRARYRIQRYIQQLPVDFAALVRKMPECVRACISNAKQRRKGNSIDTSNMPVHKTHGARVFSKCYWHRKQSKLWLIVPCDLCRVHIALCVDCDYVVLAGWRRPKL